MYDMQSGEQKEIIQDVRNFFSSKAYYSDNWFLYRDNQSNLRRYDMRTGASVEIFPNKGLNKYGEVHKIVNDKGLYKIDTDGNYTLLDKANAHYWSYVKNGSVTAEYYYNY